jgi:formylglycine-generating enzyme required for sulfatase activity
MLTVPEEYAGQLMKCPLCYGTFTVPALPSRTEQPGPQLSAKGSLLMDAEMKFAWCPPGLFLMGGNGVNDNPQHRVTISKGFWMGIYPVTQAQWQAVMGYNPSSFPGPDRPVEQVSWDDCQEFCRKMAELTNKPIRLPTEAEWEYACRAGTNTEYFSGNGEEALTKVAWYHANSGQQTHTVGEKKAANAWGLFDVHGNVWEWCQDWYGPLSSDDIKDPVNINKGDARVLRGGSWSHNAENCRAAYRYWRAPAARSYIYGLRVCFRLD